MRISKGAGTPMSRKLAQKAKCKKTISTDASARRPLITDTKRSATAPIYLDEKAVAKRWKVSIKYLQALRYKGGGPLFTVFGRNVRYHIKYLKAFEKENSFSSRAELATCTRSDTTQNLAA